MPEAVVISLKTRSIPPGEAVARSLEALERLREAGARQIYFKYCSTFDSTPEGNIGPVAAALAGRLGVDRTVFVPALPENGRTVYQGHLFVHDRLLSESGMEHHPLTPMNRSGHPPLARPAGRGAGRPHRLRHGGAGRRGGCGSPARDRGPVGSSSTPWRRPSSTCWPAPSATCRWSPAAPASRFGLPGALAEAGQFVPRPATWTGVKGPAVCLAGSCSRATREQGGAPCGSRPPGDSPGRRRPDRRPPRTPRGWRRRRWRGSTPCR